MRSTREWYVIAPDLRGFGKSAWQPQGYWFADYVADLEALLAGVRARRDGRSRRPQPRRQRRAALRRRAPGARARASISLDGFGIRAEEPSARAGEAREMARRARAIRRDFATVRELRRGRRPAAEEQSAPDARAGRCFSRAHWAEALPDGASRLASDPRHKLPFPTVYRIDETYAVWRNITAPTLWIAAADSNIPKWLDDHPEGEGATDSFAAVKRRFAHIPHGRMVTIAGCRPHAASRSAAQRRGADARDAKAFLDAPHRTDARERSSSSVHSRARRLRRARDPHRLLGHQLDRDEARARRARIRSSSTSSAPGSRSSCCSRCCVRCGVRCCPESWIAVVVTGFFQTTVNIGSTTMAVADGGAGRASVLVFTMPFWTLLLAWPVLGERVRGRQWIAIAFALAGLTLVVEPWNWEGELEAEGVGRALRVRLGVRDDRDEVFPAHARLRHAQLHRVADAGRRPAAHLAAARVAAAGDAMERDLRRLAARGRARSRRGSASAVDRVLRFLSAGTASLNMLAIPVIALLSSMAVFDERLSTQRMDRHRLHRRRPLRHLVPRLAREPPRRAAAAGTHPARRRLEAGP